MLLCCPQEHDAGVFLGVFILHTCFCTVSLVLDSAHPNLAVAVVLPLSSSMVSFTSTGFTCPVRSAPFASALHVKVAPPRGTICTFKATPLIVPPNVNCPV